ncbi:MAG TPA: hypothetical protein VM925_19935, partial [Labilithrix sp.]|nr:hypothetical protein [Labilithrix sp.]
LEQAAREGDKAGGGDRLRRALCQALAQGGHGARDGGRTRSSLLRRAATIAHRDLNDTEQAFTWLADALVAHVDGLTLDMLEALGMETKDARRAEAALSHALSEVFDGPLVRQLLARRAKIRRDQLGEAANAAADLKKLHDLSPTDQAVMDELAGLLMEQNDYKALVQLYEDQILRGKDMNSRAELARKVARIWEEQLADGREAADAWRRVLRMRAGDAEATEGLERSKTSQLKKLDGDAKVVYGPPKLVSDQPVPPPARPAKQSSAPSVIPPSQEPAASRRTGRASGPSASGPGSVPLPSQVSAEPGPEEAVTQGDDNMVVTSTPSSGTRGGPPPLPKRPVSLPPPLPESGPGDRGLENEIDASFERLELERANADAVTDGIPAARPFGADDAKSAAAPDNVGAGSSMTEVTESGRSLPGAENAGQTTFVDPKELSAEPTAEPNTALVGGSGSTTIAGFPTPQGDMLAATAVIEVDDATGADVKLDLATTELAAEPEDDVVIADDLAEDALDDGDEHTDTGAIVPPFRAD